MIIFNRYLWARHIKGLVELFWEEQPRWAYWVPVFIGLGITLYFAIPFQPHMGPVLFINAILVGLFRLKREQVAWHFGLLALIAVAVGFAGATLRTSLVMAPMIDRSIGPAMVEGTLISREQLDDSQRLLLRDLVVSKLDQDETPYQVRITLRDSMRPPELLPLGGRVRVLANLLPPAEPVMPGGYDFRRQAFFERIGAYGMALRMPEVLSLPKKNSLVLLAEKWREAVKLRVSSVLSGSEGAIAVALMTGERGAIDDVTNANMRAAGTAHLLSISGMHIGMVGGLVFFVLRALMALPPLWPLRYPIKQIAAAAGLLAVCGYTWFVGSPIPAQRSAMMTGLVFLAIILGRQAITMRGLALAAGLILLLFPESLFNPGFQMSFAAMLMLISANEWHEMRRNDEEREHLGWIRRSWVYVVGIVLTSIIAGLATMPFGAWHFHRIQLLGVIGNLISVPLTGFIVMPSMLMAYVAMPLHLDWLPLQIMQYGLLGVTKSAAWVAGMPGASLNVGQFSLPAMLLMVFGGLWFALWQTRLRLGGLVFILLGVLLTPLQSRPIALVSAEGKIALRGNDGHLYFERSARGMAAESMLSAYDGGREGQGWKSADVGIACDKLGCIGPMSIAVIDNPVAVMEDCARASILIAPDIRLRDCKAQVIDRKALREFGSHMILASGQIITARHGYTRPWQPHYGDEPYRSTARAEVTNSDEAAPPADPEP